MARTVKAVVQVERLRDQVYELIREDLRTGFFAPGQRLLEVELAERYRVSRTPIREALFQLSRDGLLAGNERGYVAPTYTRRQSIERLELKQLLEPTLAEHAVAEADAQDVRLLEKLLHQQEAAHLAAKVKAFNKANAQFRLTFRHMCKNELLIRCVTLADDHFEVARNRIHESADNRILSIRLDATLLRACQKRDKEAARAAVAEFLQFLEVYYREHATGE